jgi:uncharacterized protein (TIGR03435 family)
MKASAVLLILTGALLGQAPGAAAFEVASVKIAQPISITPEQIRAGVRPRIGMTVDAGRADMLHVSLSALVMQAYRVKPYQVSGPDWMGTQYFDISAKIPDGATKEQVPEMVRALLEERFHLAAHKESKEMLINALVEAKGGAKLKPAAPGATMDYRLTRGDNGISHVQITATVATIADTLGNFGLAERPVIDMTGIAGIYAISLDFTPPTGPSPLAGMDFSEALPQIGLKIESRKVPMDMIVVDHMEKLPTDN